LFYPAWEILPHEARLPHADVLSERLETLVTLLNATEDDPASSVTPATSPLVTTTVTALLQRTFPPDYLRAHTRRLVRGEAFDPLDLIEWLEDQGYEPEAQVTQKGELAWRGGILDIYPLSSPWPVRLEFFGNELESLRYFDPLTQISREEIQAASLPPAGELGLLKRLVAPHGEVPPPDPPAPSGDARSSRDKESSSNISQPSQTPAAADRGHATRDTSTLRSAPVLRATAAAEDGTENKRHALPFATLLDYLPRQTIVLLCDPEELAKHAEAYAEQLQPGDPFVASWREVQAQLESRGFTRLEVTETPILIDPVGPTPPSALRTPHFGSLDAFRPVAERAPEPHIAEAQRREFFHQLHRWLRQGYAVHVFCNNEGERQRFTEIWNEYGLEARGERPAARGQGQEAGGVRPMPGPPAADTASSSAPASSQTRLASSLSPRLGTLSRGFLFDDAKLVVVTDAEIFGRYRIQRPRRLKSPHAVAARSLLDINFAELEEGDFVVHLEHGIGRYLGLQRLANRSCPRPSSSNRLPSRTKDEDEDEHEATKEAEEALEYLVIEYAPSQPGETPPKLYVPVTEAHLVGKYVGAGKARPQLHTLGGKRWAKAKEQAEHAVRDLAAEFLSIQAAREALPGHAFAADSPWQGEFESAFLYEETPDQRRAIVQTKADMEKPRPMDRLICGDVAFGKTEVAIRAAFKGVMDGKQVAVLVPTTVLAQQHFNTFRERMADYPVRIELLSRFRTRGEQQRVVRDLAAGAVDIVIGTHRLVQSDIAFKDLGLVIIDEEQRFGVLQKEKFKQMRKLVDVLTLSATPIPRTLYLALTGARDMSTIETPPHDRLPVETLVAAYDERLIRDAIQREINRGGQVFFLHNRVQTIDTLAQKLATLVPRARIVIGHGQMNSDALEEVMTRFVNGEADVLLSTTIIESGLDIPNANTIIIDRADRFGLSDLYQLRGRVGRYKHQAYAYLLIPRHAGLLSDARKRISAIKQYSKLGSGFKIAMRDLEIRGAGNLLGPEQSGHITAVGFELYCQLLKQSIASLKGEQVKPRVAVEVRLDFLTLGPLEEAARGQKSKVKSPQFPELDIEVPREVATWADDDGVAASTDDASRLRPHASRARSQIASAYLPLRYIPEPQHRIDLYRKLAQATDQPALEALRVELRDRFGPLPPPVEFLLQLAELKLLASERGVSAIEVEEDRLKLTRRNDFIMPGGKFPRLTKRTAKARLGEIKRLLLTL
jgi:transcription-repair coupling factor (superfamily II helicase)